MQPSGASLSTSVLVALANEVLAGNGYRVVRDLTEFAHLSDRGLLAEDEFSVISVVAFETWPQLEAEWLDAQADLVELLSRRLSRSAPKAWDGYLVLLCAGEPLDRQSIVQIERDTTRVRKIIATLDLLLPLTLPEDLSALDDVLESLPELIATSADPTAVRIVIDAFRSMEPPLERLHALGGDA
jgi:hypothetical protein